MSQSLFFPEIQKGMGWNWSFFPGLFHILEILKLSQESINSQGTCIFMATHGSDILPLLNSHSSTLLQGVVKNNRAISLQIVQPNMNFFFQFSVFALCILRLCCCVHTYLGLLCFHYLIFLFLIILLALNYFYINIVISLFFVSVCMVYLSPTSLFSTTDIIMFKLGSHKIATPCLLSDNLCILMGMFRKITSNMTYPCGWN